MEPPEALHFVAGQGTPSSTRGGRGASGGGGGDWRGGPHGGGGDWHEGRIAEARNINKSLHFLEQVVVAMQNKRGSGRAGEDALLEGASGAGLQNKFWERPRRSSSRHEHTLLSHDTTVCSCPEEPIFYDFQHRSVSPRHLVAP